MNPHGTNSVPVLAHSLSVDHAIRASSDPPPSPSFTLDGSVVGSDQTISGATFSFGGLTTSKTNDLIVVIADSDDAYANSPCVATGVTSSSPSLSFTERTSLSDPAYHMLSVSEWYAVSPNAVSGMSFTVSYPVPGATCQTSPTFVMGLAFAVADVDTAHPFDSSPNTGGAGQLVPGTAHAGPVVTTYANDMMLGLLSIDLNAGPCCFAPPAAGATYSVIGLADFTGSAGQTAEAEANFTSSPGSYSVTYASSDFNAYAMIDDAVAEALTADPVTPGTSTLDRGQSETLTSQASGGLAPYTYSWHLAPAPGACGSGFTNVGTGRTFSVPGSLTPGTYYFCYIVTDSESPAVVMYSPTSQVVVNSALATPSTPTVSATHLDRNQTLTVSGVIPSGGTSPYHWQWQQSVNGSAYANSTLCIPSSGSTPNSGTTVSCVFPASVLSPNTTYSFQLVVTDSSATPETTTSPASPTVTVYTALVVFRPVISASRVDQNQFSAVGEEVTTGTSPYTFQWLVSVNGGGYVPVPSCGPYATSGTVNAYTVVICGFPAGTLTVSDTYSFEFHIADSANFSEAGTSVGSPGITVHATLSPGAVTPVNPTIDAGETIVLSSNVSGGFTPYSYLWLSGPSSNCGADTPIAATNAATYAATPATSTYYCYVAVDSANTSETVVSGTDLVTVDPALAVPTVSASRNALDVGQTTILTASASGGSGVYTYVWNGLPTGCTTADTAQLVCTPTVAFTAAVSVTVADGHMALVSSPLTIVVSSDPSVTVPTASATHLDVGQSTYLATSTSVGSGIGTGWAWTGLPSGCSTTNAVTLTCYPNAAGTFQVSVSFTDSNGYTAVSGGIILTVSPALTATTISASISSLDVGQTVYLTDTVSGGAGTYVYAWAGLPLGCASTNTPVLTCTPYGVGTGSYAVRVTVTDSNTETVTSLLTGGGSLQISPALVLTYLNVSRTNLDVGQPLTISVSASGGFGAYIYAWSGLPLGCPNQDVATITCTPNTVGTYTLAVTVSDANQFSVTDRSVEVVNDYATGTNPQYASFDPVNGYLYIPDTGSNQLTVFDPATGATVVTISTGTGPTNAFYDPLNQFVYVTNVYSNTVNVVNTTTNTVVLTLTVNTGPNDVALDPANGYLYIADWYSGQVTILNGANNTFVGNLTLGPTSIESGTIAFDNANGDLYVTDCGSNNVTVIHAANQTILTNISVGTCPYGIGYDPANGEIWVADDFTNLVSVISGATNTVVDTMVVGLYPDGFAFNPVNGQVYIASCTSTTSLMVVNGTTDAVTATLNLGTCLTTAVYDSANGVTYVPDWYSASIFSVSGPLPTTTVTVMSTPAVSTPLANRTSGDVGQHVSFQVTASSGSGGYSFAWSLPAGLGCGTPVTAGVTSTVSCTLVTAGTYSVDATVTDSNGGSLTSSSLGFTVYADPKVASPSASASSADVTQTVTFTAAATPGAGTLTYAWSGFPASGCAGMSSATVVCTFGSAGSFTPSVTVTDANGYSVSATMAAPYVVSVDPTIGTLTAAPGTLDLGQSTTFTVVATNGTALASTYTWFGLPAGCTSISSLTLKCTPTASGTFGISASITDSNGMTVYSTPYTLVVSPALGAVLVSLSRTTLDVGQQLTIAANAAGGTGVYTYAWTGLPAGCFNGGSSTIQCWPTTAGTSSVSVTVSDSNGASVTLTTPTTVTVSADPTVGTPAASTSTLDLGQSTTLSIAATNGTGSATLTWWGLPAGCTSAASMTLTCTPTVTGSFGITVTETDSNGVTVVSGPVTLTVSRALGAPTVAASVVSLDVGQSVTLVVNVTGGSAPWTFVWSGLPKGCAGNSATVTCSPTAAGTSSATVTVTDGNGISQTSTGLNLTVSPRLTAGSIALSPPVLDAGQSTNLTVGVSGGSGGLSYLWSGLPTGCTGSDAATITCHPSSTGTSWVTVWVTDRNGGGVTVGPVALTVDPVLGTPVVSVSQSSFELGGSVTFSASVSGGSAPLTYSWSGLPKGCVSVNAPTVTCVPSNAGTSTVRVSVTDAAGTTTTSAPATLTVNPVPAQGFAGGANGLEWTLLGLVVVLLLLAILGIAYVLMRRKRGGSNEDHTSKGGSNEKVAPAAAAAVAPSDTSPSAPSNEPDWKEDDSSDGADA